MKKQQLVLGMVIVGLLAIFGIADLLFRPGFYSSHDGVGHVIRMEEFYRAFRDGQIPVRWSGRLYYGYGYPFYNFNYPAVYYAGVPLMAIGVSASDAMKAELAAAFLSSGIVMFLYLQRKIKLPYAVLGAVLYLYAPYRLSNIYVRGSVAEAAAFVFPPLLLWGAESLDRKRNILWLSLVFGLLGVSHNISALLLTAFFFGYVLILTISQKNPRLLIKAAISFVLGMLMAAFFMVPALYEKKWTFLDLTIAKDYPNYFVNLLQLLNPTWGFGSAGSPGGMSLCLGLVQIALVFILIKNFKKTPLFIFSFLAIVVSIFFMLPVSKVFWDHVPLLPFVQFPWRFTMLTIPAMAIFVALGIAARGVSQKATVFLVVLTILSTSYMWFRNETVYVPDVSGDAIEGSTTWAHEQATRWFFPKPTAIPANKVASLDGPVDYSIKYWKTGYHEYLINALTNEAVIENTMYYPGWRVWVDQKEVSVDYQNSLTPGKLVFVVTAGQHLIVSKFTETPLRLVCDWVSLVSTFLVTGTLGVTLFRSRGTRVPFPT